MIKIDDDTYNQIMAEKGIIVKTKPSISNRQGNNYVEPNIVVNKINELYALAEKVHELDKNGLENLKDAVNAFTEEDDCPPDIYKTIQFVYTNAFKEGILESIRLLQKK